MLCQNDTKWIYDAIGSRLLFEIKIPVPLGVTDFPYRSPAQVNSDVVKCVLSGRSRPENSGMSTLLKKIPLFPR